MSIVQVWQERYGDQLIICADLRAKLEAAEIENKSLTRASSVPAQQLAELHLRNERRLTARITELEKEVRLLVDDDDPLSKPRLLFAFRRATAITLAFIGLVTTIFAVSFSPANPLADVAILAMSLAVIVKPARYRK